MSQSPGLVHGQRFQPVAPNPLAITNISILVVPNTPTTRMLILLILIILPATPFPLSIPAFHTTPIPTRHSPYPQHSTPLLFPHAIPLIPSIPHHSCSRTPFPLSQHSTPPPVPARHSPYPSIPHHSCSRTPFPLSPSIPYRSYSRTPFPLSIPAFHTAPIPARHSPYPPAFHTAPISARQTPLTTRSRHLSKHPHIPCLTAIPYLFAMASMASVKESRLLFIDFLLSLCLER